MQFWTCGDLPDCSVHGRAGILYCLFSFCRCVFCCDNFHTSVNEEHGTLRDSFSFWDGKQFSRKKDGQYRPPRHHPNLTSKSTRTRVASGPLYSACSAEPRERCYVVCFSWPSDRFDPAAAQGAPAMHGNLQKHLLRCC